LDEDRDLRDIHALARTEDIGTATTRVTVADEVGNVVKRQVAKQEFRKRTVLFDFDADALADDDFWLTGFVPDAVYVDMPGDDFLDPGEARNLMLIENDWGGALTGLQQAVALDPTFTLARHKLASGVLAFERHVHRGAPKVEQCS
jgi:hypothetical protein